MTNFNTTVSTIRDWLRPIVVRLHGWLSCYCEDHSQLTQALYFLALCTQTVRQPFHVFCVFKSFRVVLKINFCAFSPFWISLLFLLLALLKFLAMVLFFKRKSDSEITKNFLCITHTVEHNYRVRQWIGRFCNTVFSWFGNTGAEAAIAILLPTSKHFSCNGAVDWSTTCFCCESVLQKRWQFGDRSAWISKRVRDSSQSCYSISSCHQDLGSKLRGYWFYNKDERW